MNRRLITRIGAGLIFAYLLITRFVSHRAATPASTTAPIAQANPDEVVLGSLRFTRCPEERQHASETFCVPFHVPERRDQPAGRQLDLRVELVRSDAQAANADLVVLLAGGPGQAASEAFDGVASAFAPLLKHHHVLLVDQRGTGGSHPLKCKQEDPELDLPQLDLDRVRTQVKACLAEVQKDADPRFYATTDFIEDLEAVRLALGAPRYDLVGVSYGTRVAQQYLLRHPDGVRSVVIDGVVPNAEILGETMARDLQSSLDVQLASCEKDARCKKRFGDPRVTLGKLRDTLRAQPQDVAYRDPLTYTEKRRTLGEMQLAALVRMFAYSTETAALLPLVLDEAMHGRYGPLLGQIALLEGALGALGSGMPMSVLCTEDAGLMHEPAPDRTSLLGDSLVRAMKAQCEVWPHGTMPTNFHAPVTGDKPVLLLSGELDPVTPPTNADEVARHLSNARTLLAKGNGHNVIGRGCMPRLVERFIDELNPKSIDASCLDVLGPAPAFTDFDGAAP